MTEIVSELPTSLPKFARRSINRCNLPAVILGSLAFQAHPASLRIDGVHVLHRELFHALDELASVDERAAHFMEYMRCSFLLDNLDEAGLPEGHQTGRRRGKANYLRLLRGWMFDANGIEGAVLKSWVESRFGLLPRNHKGPLGDYTQANYQAYLADYAHGLYNTNALEAQLDLLYSFCQYELQCRYPKHLHWRLFRGVNRVADHDLLDQSDPKKPIVLLNNLNSFTSSAEHADTFGDAVFQTQVPASKLLFFPDLLPGVLTGEQEFLVIGGAYRVTSL